MPPRTPEDRPTQPQAEAAAVVLIERHSQALLATARRYAPRPADAEDAYQRGLEILLTKAPTTDVNELLPWLRTVIKHEALALGRAGKRVTPSDSTGVEIPDAREATVEIAERREQLNQGSEAMARLKPAEARCLTLKAQGLSYAEICEATGFSYTKVNRCIAEGRRAFHATIARISAGTECERLAPILARMADGEASAADMLELRPHLRHCGGCRQTLRDYRSTPRRFAALFALPTTAFHRALGRCVHVADRVRSAVERAFAAAHPVGVGSTVALAATAVALQVSKAEPHAEAPATGNAPRAASATSLRATMMPGRKTLPNQGRATQPSQPRTAPRRRPRTQPTPPPPRTTLRATTAAPAYRTAAASPARRPAPPEFGP